MKITKTASGKTKIVLTKSEWKSIGKKAGWVNAQLFGNYDSLDLGPNPSGEECVQVGSDEYAQWHQVENRAYINQLKRMFPDQPPTAAFSISANAHDFGTYHDVVIKFLENDEDAVDYAFNVENNAPEYWDELAKEELRSKGYPFV